MPGPPASVKFSEVFATSVKVVWDPPLNDGGNPITHYIVDKRETSRSNWAQVSDKIKGDTHEFNVQKLIEGHEYQFRVRAQNSWGVGEAFISNPIITKNPFSKSNLNPLFSMTMLFKTLLCLYGINPDLGVTTSCAWPMQGSSHHQRDQGSHDGQLDRTYR